MITVFFCYFVLYENTQVTQKVITPYLLHLQVLSIQRNKNYKSNFSLKQCVDIQPRLRSKYAIFIQLIGDGGVYFQSAMKLAVRLNWYLKREVREKTDVILHLVDGTSKWIFDEAIGSAFRAGFDHVCQSQRIGTGSYNRFVIFNMVQYESVLYIDADVLPLNDFSELIVNGTLALRAAARHMMWFHERNCDWFNSGVMLVVPEPDLYVKLMHVYEAQSTNTGLAVVDHGPKPLLTDPGMSFVVGAIAKIRGTKPSCHKTVTRPAPNYFGDQALLNHVFHPNKNDMLEMDAKFNNVLYEDTRMDSEILRDTSLVHFIKTKPWKWYETECYVSHRHPSVCSLWFETPISLSSRTDKK